MADVETVAAGARFAGLVLSAMSAAASAVVIVSYLRMAARFRAHMRQLVGEHKPAAAVHRGGTGQSHESFLVTPCIGQHCPPLQNFGGAGSIHAPTQLAGAPAITSRRPSAQSGAGGMMAPGAAAPRGSYPVRLSQSAATTEESMASGYQPSTSSWSLMSICKQQQQQQQRAQQQRASLPRPQLAGPIEYYGRVAAAISPERLGGLGGHRRRMPRAPSSKIVVLASIDLLMHVAWIINASATRSSAMCTAPTFFLQWTQLVYMFYLASFALTSLGRLRNMRASRPARKMGHRRHAIIVAAVSAAALLLSLLPAILSTARYDAALQTCWLEGGSPVALRWVWMTLNSWVVLSLVFLAAASVYIGLILSHERRSILFAAASAVPAAALRAPGPTVARTRGVPHPLYIPPLSAAGSSLPTAASSRFYPVSGPHSASHYVPTPMPSAGSSKAGYGYTQANYGTKAARLTARNSLGISKGVCSYVRLGGSSGEGASTAPSGFAMASNPIALAHAALHGRRATGGHRAAPAAAAGSHATMYTHRSISSAGELVCRCRGHSVRGVQTPSASSHDNSRPASPLPLPAATGDSAFGVHGGRQGRPAYSGSLWTQAQRLAPGRSPSLFQPASARAPSLHPAQPLLLQGHGWRMAKHMSMPVGACGPVVLASGAAPAHRPPGHIRQHSMPFEAHRLPTTPAGSRASGAQDRPEKPPFAAMAIAMPPATDEQPALPRRSGWLAVAADSAHGWASRRVGRLAGSSTVPAGSSKDVSTRHIRRIERRVHVLIATGAMRVAMRAVVPFVTQLAMVVWSTAYAIDASTSSHTVLYAAATLLLSAQGLLDMMLYYIFEMQPDPAMPSLPSYSSTTLSGASAGAVPAAPGGYRSQPASSGSRDRHPYPASWRESCRSCAPHAVHRAHPQPYHCCCASCRQQQLVAKPGAPRRSASLASASGSGGDQRPMFALDVLGLRRADRTSNAVQSDTLHGSDCAVWSHLDAHSMRDSASISRFSATPAAPHQPHLPVLNGWEEADSEEASPRPSSAMR